MSGVSSRVHRNQKRVRTLKEGKAGAGPVIYWMSRDQRAKDNWALLHAQGRALQLGRPLVVVFCLSPAFLGAMHRQYDFMLRGLEGFREASPGGTFPSFFSKAIRGKKCRASRCGPTPPRSSPISIPSG